MTPKSRLLDLRRAAAEYEMCYAALYKLVQNGTLPVVKFPDHRRLYLRREDLDRLIDQHTEVA